MLSQHWCILAGLRLFWLSRQHSVFQAMLLNQIDASRPWYHSVRGDYALLEWRKLDFLVECTEKLLIPPIRFGSNKQKVHIKEKTKSILESTHWNCFNNEWIYFSWHFVCAISPWLVPISWLYHLNYFTAFFLLFNWMKTHKGK